MSEIDVGAKGQALIILAIGISLFLWGMGVGGCIYLADLGGQEVRKAEAEARNAEAEASMLRMKGR